jgi:hypothetical protein
MDLQAYNNERFQFTQNLTNWAAVYSLSSATFRLQIRTKAADPDVLLDFSSAPGSVDTITYNNTSHVMIAQTTTARVRSLEAGSYDWDFGFTLASEFTRIDGGTIVFVDGVTR